MAVFITSGLLLVAGGTVFGQTVGGGGVIGVVGSGDGSPGQTDPCLGEDFNGITPVPDRPAPPVPSISPVASERVPSRGLFNFFTGAGKGVGTSRSSGGATRSQVRCLPPLIMNPATGKCRCPGGQVLKDGKCVDASQCDGLCRVRGADGTIGLVPCQIVDGACQYITDFPAPVPPPRGFPVTCPPYPDWICRLVNPRR